MQFLSLDVGEKRIGVAFADSQTRFPVPYTTLSVDGTELLQIQHILTERAVDQLIVGYPRNQRGELTAQTKAVVAFVEKLKPLAAKVVFQDESLTSISAEQYLKNNKKNYTKADIDAHAAAIILSDYLEAHYAHGE